VAFQHFKVEPRKLTTVFRTSSTNKTH